MSTKSSGSSKRGTPQPPELVAPAPKVTLTAAATTTTKKPTSAAISPTRQSRIQEKAELQLLNDRLATYIERVRSLEFENQHLTRIVQQADNEVGEQTARIRQIYERELNEVREVLDGTAQEKARLEIDTNRLLDECVQLRGDLTKVGAELTASQKAAHTFETLCTQLQSECHQLTADVKTSKEEASKHRTALKETKKELEQCRRQQDDYRTQLEHESLSRVGAENEIQTLREQLAFKEQLIVQEAAHSSQSRRSQAERESEIDGRVAEQCELKLQGKLQELRTQYEQQLEQVRQDMHALYEAKIKSLQAVANRQSHATNATLDELRQLRTRIETLTVRCAELDAENVRARTHAHDLEALLDGERERHSGDLMRAEAEVDVLRDEMSRQLHEYQDLMSIKDSLDLEIAAYRKLLEAEESRLNISPPLKRRRVAAAAAIDDNSFEYYAKASAHGPIEVQDVECGGGMYVKLRNNSDVEMPLGGWQILRKKTCGSGGDEKPLTVYKFHHKLKVAPGADVTVWSAANEMGQEHDPPTNLVMKTQKWEPTETAHTVVVDDSGVEVASFERLKRPVRRFCFNGDGGGGVDGEEELHHQIGDPSAMTAKERCVIM